VNKFRKLSVAALVVGLIVATALIGWFGAWRVLHAILSVGKVKFLGFCLLQILVMLFLGVTWRIITPGWRGSVIPFIWGRLVRDSAGSCLPFSVLGGLLSGARATNLHGVSWHMAAVSTIVDITTEFAAEVAFAACGMVIVLMDVKIPEVRLTAQIGLGVAAVVLIAVIKLQHGVAPIFASMGKRILSPWIAQGQIDLGAEAELNALYGDKRVLGFGILLHFIGWMGKALGNWVAFHLLGVDISLPAAFAIEGLLHAALAAAVAIPGYAGVQEAGYVALGALFGVPAELCLGVSLIRRARDFAIGIPVLLLWQLVEVKRLKQS